MLVSQVFSFSSFDLLNASFNGVKVLNQHLHTFHRVHITTGVYIDSTRSVFRKRVNGDMRFSKSVDDCYTLWMELM